MLLDRTSTGRGSRRANNQGKGRTTVQVLGRTRGPEGHRRRSHQGGLRRASGRGCDTGAWAECMATPRVTPPAYRAACRPQPRDVRPACDGRRVILSPDTTATWLGSFSVAGHPVTCRMLGSIPRPHPQDAGSKPQVVRATHVLRYCQRSPGNTVFPGKRHRWRGTEVKPNETGAW